MTQHQKDYVQATAVTMLVSGAVGVAAVLMRSRRRATRPPEHVRALQGYLLDHLAASDAACSLVGRLMEAQEGTSVGALAVHLAGEFHQERNVIRAVLHSLGAIERSFKRALGHAGGAASQLAGPALVGERPVFLALETLATGVQAKRLLWRALRTSPVRSGWPFDALEAQAQAQWQEIEGLRQVFAHGLFEPRHQAARA